MHTFLHRLWNNRTFATQVMFSFLFITVLYAVVSFFVNYQYMQDLFRRKITDFMQTNITQASRSIETTLHQYEHSAIQLVFDQEFLDTISKMDSPDPAVSIVAQQTLRQRIFAFVSYMESIIGAAVQSPGHPVIMYDKKTDPDNQTELRRYEDYFPAKTNAAGGQTGWSATQQRDSASGVSSYILIYRTRIIDYVRQEELGGFAMSFDEQVLQAICDASLISKDHSANYVFIADTNNKVISHYDKSRIGGDFSQWLPLQKQLSSGETAIFSAILNGKPCTVCVQSMPERNWQVVYVLLDSYVLGELQFVRAISYIFFIIFVGAAIILSALMTRALAKSVHQLVFAMKQAENGHMHTQIKASSYEVSLIGDGFNRMMATIGRLMDNLRLQMERVTDATRKEKEAEIMALEAQINPHFLYNTLDSINWLAIENEQMQISAMLKNLAEILRYSIDKSNIQCTINSEVRYLNQYLFLQKFRFAEKFDYTFTVDPTVEACRIHKLLFQPLIENAILHGFEGIDHGGVLTVSFAPEGDDRVCVVICDNGKGMSEEQLNRLRRRDPDVISIGVANVIARLDSYYGDSYSIDIVSATGMGCKITILFPRLSQSDAQSAIEVIP